ncbi:MAG: thiamine pyrophosphate-binding protein [Pseudomonadota bacterium]
MPRQTAARHIVEALRAQGVSHVFCVPGESYLALLDALHDAADIRLIACRHEAAAANMAEAAGKLTGRPGVAMVTRGPGATHAAIGVHTAFQDSTPMILFIGQVARDQRDREAFQEVDYRRFFAPLAKRVEEIDAADRAPEYVARAFSAAMNGRPGPVVLSLPEDMLTEEADAGPVARVEPAVPGVREADLVRLQRMLAEAKRPLVIAGGPGWSPETSGDLARFAERNALPVALSFRAKDTLDNRHPNYVGDVGIAPNPQLAERVRGADLVLALGPRLGEMTTSGYSLFSSPTPAQTLVHAHAGAEELGRVFQPALALNAPPAGFMPALASITVENPPWTEETKTARAEYEAFSQPVGVEERVNLSIIWSWLSERLPEDAIVTNGAGNYASWLHRFYAHKAWRTQLAPTSGAMGYGVPAALAAKALHPERTVVCAAGDGCFMMSSNELATAVQYDLPVVFLVSNNGTYGTIRMHQERDYPGRVAGTDLVNPEFAAYARSFGALGARVERTEDFEAVFEEALGSGLPAVIDLAVSPREIAPGRRLP